MLIEMKEGVLGILSFSWPMIVISVIIAITLRIAYLVQFKKKFVLHNELFKLLFIIYILCLFHAVTFQDVSWSTANYIPFKEIFRYDIGSGLFYKNILGNVLLFLPYGFFIGMYIKIDKPLLVIALSSVASLAIEVTQLLIGRVFDVDDIILNIIGAIVGLLLYKFLVKISDKIPKIFKKNWILNILSVLLVGGLVWFLVL